MRDCMAPQVSYKDHLNIPNLLTLLRISLIPVLVVIFYLPFEWRNLACAMIFMLAALTDWLDGFLARKLKQVSAFGEFLKHIINSGSNISPRPYQAMPKYQRLQRRAKFSNFIKRQAISVRLDYKWKRNSYSAQ